MPGKKHGALEPHASDAEVTAFLDQVASMPKPVAAGKTGRLVNLPAPGGDPVPESEYVRGDDLFDNSYNSVGGPIGEAGGQWGPGATASFRIAGTPCQVDAGETITVRVVHTPTESVVIREILSVS